MRARCDSARILEQLGVEQLYERAVWRLRWLSILSNLKSESQQILHFQLLVTDASFVYYYYCFTIISIITITTSIITTTILAIIPAIIAVLAKAKAKEREDAQRSLVCLEALMFVLCIRGSGFRV